MGKWKRQIKVQAFVEPRGLAFDKSLFNVVATRTPSTLFPLGLKC